jgi:hypothetical protein
MKNCINIISTILVSFFVMSGCATSGAVESENMMILGSALTKLSAAVESTVRYKNPPADIKDTELLVLATRHDPDLLTRFQSYTLKVHRQNGHAMVLVCSKDGSVGLLEDSNCTAKLDKHLWEGQLSKPCEFTLTVQQVCGAN